MDYKSLSITEENLLREKASLKNICECIEEGKSWYFDAGAGAGKTFTLIETLKYIIDTKSKTFKKNNQKILCITFTNVAANEIRERLGSTSLIEISTIHDCVWRIISPYQRQLVVIHKQKLSDEITRLENSLQTEDWAENYRILSGEEQINLLNIMNNRRKDYYKYKNYGAEEFKEVFKEITSSFNNIMRNVNNFKRIADSILKLNEFKKTILKIDEMNKDFLEVKYDARFNNDRLNKMIISHDTLLEYTFKIISENDALKQIICDKFPIVLVDEYQDTSHLIISSLSLIEEYSKKIKHFFVVGYYGDVKQNIYDKGVGIKFKNIHPNLKQIQKTFNRRSSPQIISIANKIRNDGLLQESIYSSFPAGDIEFYNFSTERQEVISFYTKKWNISKDNKLHCLELTNEKVAEQSGFLEFYKFFRDSKWYKDGKNYELLREHILSLDERKLGIIQKLIFRIFDFKTKLEKKSSMLLEIFPKAFFKGMNIIELKNLFNKLEDIQGNTLKEYLINIFSLYNKGDLKYDLCIEYIMAEDIKSINDIQQFIIYKLYNFLDEEENSEDNPDVLVEVANFLNISMTKLKLWYTFVTDTCENEVVFHTYHSTKGREFDNVLIFMNSQFGKKRDYFSDLLKVLTEKNEQEELETDLESARNLLYVAITRATKNLCIVYYDTLEEKENLVLEVFGKINNSL